MKVVQLKKHWRNRHNLRSVARCAVHSRLHELSNDHLIVSYADDRVVLGISIAHTWTDVQNKTNRRLERACHWLAIKNRLSLNISQTFLPTTSRKINNGSIKRDEFQKCLGT